MKQGDLNRERAAGGRVRQPVSIRSLLEWAFATECASLDLTSIGSLGGTPMPGYGMEYVMIQQAMLGCRVDGGGYSHSHPDADVVAAAVAALPAAFGGRSMAVHIAELARARRTPDCMIGDMVRVEPRDWACNRHGWHAKTERCGSDTVVSRGRTRTVERRWCPVTFSPSPSQIAGARRGYLAWWGALLELRHTFQTYNDLSAWEVTDDMPPMAPWKKCLTKP